MQHLFNPRPPRHLRRSFGLIVLVVGAATAAMGCSRSSAPPATTAQVGTTVSPATNREASPGNGAETDTTATRDTSLSSTSTSVSTTASTDSPDADYASFCERFREIAMAIQEFSTSPGEPGFEQELVQLKAYFAELASIAPAPIRADVELLNNEIAKMDPDNPSDPSSAGRDASDRIETWTKANCGFDPNDP